MSINRIKAFLCGSGVEGMQNETIATELLRLIQSNRSPSSSDAPLRVAYLGTATYDIAQDGVTQLRQLTQRGCDVRWVRVADPAVTTLEAADRQFIEEHADAVLVSGGNTLYAVRRWVETGVAAALRVAAARGCVLSGGSAGAICWCTSGHSDSADPASAQLPMLLRAAGREADAAAAEKDVSSSADGSFQYIRVGALGLLPGLLCPHYDRTEERGHTCRYVDVGKMVKRHPTERCVAIDHLAAVVLPGDGSYRVVAPADAQRQLPPPDVVAAASPDEQIPVNMRPGVFVLEVDRQGLLHRWRVPEKGKVTDLFHEPTGPLVRDPFEMYYAMMNPTPSTERLVRPGAK
ncbi:dipeptidase E [Strigomonas culicis]|uniref:Dipeptidase E n=1 Tax=Strigomonas culicis TaxID=28005 RepID=S9W543_9TRYP|nr:dipeptidase E [Strigomonas culicis]|eukprot:EPY34446.1 dipeptidase E [Strigomonas culicis]